MAELPQPVAEITLKDRTVTRGLVKHDYGNRLHWKVLRNGEEVSSPEARSADSFTLEETLPGRYEIVLETWKHEGYKSKALGKYIEISNKVSIQI